MCALEQYYLLEITAANTKGSATCCRRHSAAHATTPTIASSHPGRYPLTAIYRAILLTLDRLIEETESQMNGFVMVVDFSQFSLRQSRSVSPKMLRLMVSGLQVRPAFCVRFLLDYMCL